MADNEEIIGFVADWSSLNVDKIVDYFAPTGVYHNMMNQPVQGHDNLRRLTSAASSGSGQGQTGTYSTS